MMIQNNQELEATLDRIERFQKQVEKLREVETNPRNYELSAGGFLLEIDQMYLELAEYLSTHPSELIKLIAEACHTKIDDALFKPLMYVARVGSLVTNRVIVKEWQSASAAIIRDSELISTKFKEVKL